jgi:hypothetical protein
VPDLDLLRSLKPPVEPASPRIVARARRRSRPRRRRRRPVLLTAPVVAAALFALLLTQDRQAPFAEAAIKAAEASPRLLLEGWKVTRVDEWDGFEGEMTFERDGRRIDLSWGSERTIKGNMQRVGRATVAGRPATIVVYAGTNDFTAIWDKLNARGNAADLAEFKRALAAVHRVSAEDWLKALPPSAVQPRAQTGAIDGMLEGIPLPPGFQAPRAEGATRDRYQLGARVVGAVVCTWIARHLDGDPAAAKALDTARGWPILRELAKQGAYHEVVFQYADAVNGRGNVPGDKLGLTVEGTYEEAFGC